MSVLNDYKICFLGRTGNGKTTLINALYGTKFPTDPLVSCTKELYRVSILDNCPVGFDSLTVFDTPGIGEFSSDERYQKFYEEAVSECDCVILVTTFDRTDAPAQRLLLKLKPYIKSTKTKFIIVLNHIDSTIIASDKSYAPWDEVKNVPTQQCENNIKERMEILKDRFCDIFIPFEIIPVCGLRNYGIESLRKVIKL